MTAKQKARKRRIEEINKQIDANKLQLIEYEKIKNFK